MRGEPTLLVLTPTHAVHGGVERIVEALHDGLPAHGFRVVVGLAKGRFHDPEAYRRAYPQLATVDLEAGTGTRLGRLRGLRRALEAVRPQVVLGARLFDAYEAVAAAKLAGAALRLAVTIQATEPEYVADLARYADFVDLCVASNARVAEDVRRGTSLPPERIVAIPGGARRPEQLTAHDDARPLRLGYVGRLEAAQKRIGDLPATLAALAARGVPWTCRIVGTGPDEVGLRRALEQHGLLSRVSLEGWASSERLYAEVYPELDVLLHFAAFEGMPIAPREAMAHGVVPVVSRFAGFDDDGQFVDERTALTFAVGDLDAAAAAVARLHGDRALLRRLSRGARASQVGVHSLEGSLAAWAEALHATLAREARLGPALPALPGPAGRLARLGLPPALAEALRRLLGRRVRHGDAGSEWPHCGARRAPDP